MVIVATLILLVIQVLNVIITSINKKGEDKISFLTKFQIFLSIVAFGAGFSILLYNEDKSKLKDKLEKEYRDSLRVQLERRDGLHQIQDSIQNVFYINKLDSSYQRSIMASNDALAKYNLILIDSLHTVTEKINIKSLKEPQLIIPPALKYPSPSIYFKSDSLNEYVSIKLESINNISYNVDLNYIVLWIERNGDEIYFSTVDTGGLLLNRNYLAENLFATATFPINDKCKQIEDGLLIIYGSFSNSPDLRNTKRFREGMNINFKTRIVGAQLPANFIDKIYEKVKRRGVIR